MPPELANTFMEYQMMQAGVLQPLGWADLMERPAWWVRDLSLIIGLTAQAQAARMESRNMGTK